MSTEGDDEMQCVEVLPITDLIITTRETGDALRLGHESSTPKAQLSQIRKSFPDPVSAKSAKGQKGAVLDIVYSPPSFLRRYKRCFR